MRENDYRDREIEKFTSRLAHETRRAITLLDYDLLQASKYFSYLQDQVSKAAEYSSQSRSNSDKEVWARILENRENEKQQSIDRRLEEINNGRKRRLQEILDYQTSKAKELGITLDPQNRVEDTILAREVVFIGGELRSVTAAELAQERAKEEEREKEQHLKEAQDLAQFMAEMEEKMGAKTDKEVNDLLDERYERWKKTQTDRPSEDKEI